MKQLQFVRDDGEDCTTELLEFAQVIGLDVAAPGRYSSILLLQLYVGMKSRRQNPAKVVTEIRALEGTGPASRMKPATAFKGGLLRGLMHKHYATGGVSYLARNIKQEIERHGLPLLKRMVREAKRSGEERYFTEADAYKIARDSTDSYLRRGARQELTGEWLIFARHNRANYYLTIASHQSDECNRSVLAA